MKKRSRICDTCGRVEETFSCAATCASCSFARKEAQAIQIEHDELLALGYGVLSGPHVDEHNHRKWQLKAPCCSAIFTPTFGNVKKQLKSHGKPPCASCGGKARMSKAMSAYVGKHGADYDLAKFEEYSRKIRRLTGRTYECWKHVINPLDHKRGRHIGDWHLDHRVPIIWCFKNGIAPEVAASAQNLQMLPVKDNLQKGGKLLSDDEAMAILKESATSRIFFDAVGDGARNKVELVADTANIWSTAEKIIVREREYRDHPAAVLARVQNALGKNTTRLGARKLRLSTVNEIEAKHFLETWHVQGSTPCTLAFGLFRNDELLSLMTFGKPRYKQEAEWELLRFCSRGDISVSGAGSRLFSKFVSETAPNKVVSYSLNRWGTGEIYKVLGFLKKSSNPSPVYLWRADGKLRSWRASILRARRKGIAQSGGEIEGTLKVHDPGSSTWLWVPRDERFVQLIDAAKAA